MQIDDTTGGGFVRRWTLVAGFPACVEDALPPGDSGALPAYQRNAGVRSLAVVVETYEAAQALISRGEPEETAPDAAQTAFHAAQAVVADAAALTAQHALWRTPEPPEGDPGHEAWANAGAAVLAALDALAAQSISTDPRPVPSQVPMWAAQAALKQAGHYDAINAAVLGMETSNPPVFFAWTMGNFASRTSAFIATLASSFSMTEGDIDAVFRAADQIAAVAG